MNLLSSVDAFTGVNLFTDGKDENKFVGRPFKLDFDTVKVLIADSKKAKVNGIPKGAFLLAYYDNVDNDYEVLLLRAIKNCELPSDLDMINTMIEYYKDGVDTSKNSTSLDPHTRYELSFSGLECKVLGSFYLDENEKIKFGADVENFYSANNYKVYKPEGRILEYIVNCNYEGNQFNFKQKIGNVRYSSTRKFQQKMPDVPVLISPQDFLGKRTALFGMTRTGKSNTVKKIIEQTVNMSNRAECTLYEANHKLKSLSSFNKKGDPLYNVGQIIFDINGEYANPNLQDEGTAIFELYKKDVIRYSVIEKEGFNMMKVNFYYELENGFNLLESHFNTNGINGDYINNFRNISLEAPEDYDDKSTVIRYERKKAAYLCTLYMAGFTVPTGFKVKFRGFKELNDMVGFDPSKGINLKEATSWFTCLWKNYKDLSKVSESIKKGKEWADDELKAILAMLTRYKEPMEKGFVSGYHKLKPIIKYHSHLSQTPFHDEIIKNLREGKIVIADLSNGDPEIQSKYSEQICQRIFHDCMSNFTNNRPNNFIQFYFEEAHNLFPKKDDKDLSQIYARIAKEGAKLNLGMIYATQEVSSISSNILKNTQNWFISHLNNVDEIRELKKYYDFEDFTDSLIKFSSENDKGFARIKTYSNSFIIPVQIDKFTSRGNF